MKGYFSVCLFLAVPSAIWLAISPIITSDFSSFAFSLGGFLGVFGFALFTLSLLLSMRIPLIERVFGNLGTAYRFHQWAGTIATILLVLHPLLLAVPRIMYFPGSLIEFFIPLHTPFQMLGVLGLVLLVICIFITFFVSLPYHIWKMTHRFLAVAFLLGALHGIFIEGTISFNPAERILFALFMLAGLGAVVYRVLGKKSIVKKTSYTLAKVETIGTVITLTLSPIGKPMAFRAGQFAYLTIHDSRLKDEHPFSIVSAEGSKDLIFMAKILGDDTALFPLLHVGTAVDVEGPYGNFSYARGGKRQLWIAGGIGITPFMSLASSLPSGFYDVDLYYSVKTASEAVSLAELQTTIVPRSDIRIHLWATDVQGYLTCDALQKAGVDFSMLDDILLCGPSGMTLAIRNGLIRCGIRPGHIHAELFATRSLNILPAKK